MATAFSVANVAEIFKRLYPDGVEHLVIDESPVLGLVQKNSKAFKGFSGSGKELAWRVANGGQASGAFATAQSNAGVSTIKKPFITRGRLYDVRQLMHEDMEASRDSAGALVTLVKEATNTAMQNLKRRAGSIILGDGSGAIGQISAGSTVGSTSITLNDISSVVNFFPGQRLQAFATVVGGLRSAGAVVTITGVNEDTGVLTSASNFSAQIAAIVASDFLVPEGDFLAVPQGMFGWNPTTAPVGGDSFFGIDRSTYQVAMSGGRYAPTSGSIDEIIKDAMARHARQGGHHDSLILNPDDWSDLEKQSNNWQRINKNAVGSDGNQIASIGFNALVMNGPIGAVNVYSDPYMGRKKAKLTKLSSWEIWSLGEMFRLLTAGANSEGMVRNATSDGSELRFGGYWNLVLRIPRDAMDIVIP